MSSLREIRAARLYVYFSNRLCDLRDECNATIELIKDNQLGTCYKKILREEDFKIRSMRFYLKLCIGLRDKYFQDSDEDWIDNRKRELDAIIQFYS